MIERGEQVNTGAWMRSTASTPGAVAVITLTGDVERCLSGLTGVVGWPVGTVRLVDLPLIDRLLVARVSEGTAEMMPHGGERVVHRLIDHLNTTGIRPAEIENAAPLELFPEAADVFEALALKAISRAASPRAIDPLLRQSAIWSRRPVLSDEDRARSCRLNRLINPPTVVLAGRPNVGKSTLTNALLGRSISIAHDESGTTRDYTATRLDLGGLVVRWCDTPGLAPPEGPIETEAQAVAARLLEQGDLLIAMTDAEHDWPELPRNPDLTVASKSDLAARDDADVVLSALTGAGLAELCSAASSQLVSAEDLNCAGPWLFDDALIDV